MSFKLLQLSNAPTPILVTPSGMTILVKPLQPKNVLRSIRVKLLLKVTLVKPEHPPKARSPIDFILSGITTLVSFVQPLNAKDPIVV